MPRKRFKPTLTDNEQLAIDYLENDHNNLYSSLTQEGDGVDILIDALADATGHDPDSIYLEYNDDINYLFITTEDTEGPVMFEDALTIPLSKDESKTHEAAQYLKRVINRGQTLRERILNEVGDDTYIHNIADITDNPLIDGVIHIQWLSDEAYNYRSTEYKRVKNRIVKASRGARYNIEWRIDMKDAITHESIRDILNKQRPDLSEDSEEYWLEAQRIQNETGIGLNQNGSPDYELGGFFDWLRGEGKHTTEMTSQEIAEAWDNYLALEGEDDRGPVTPLSEILKRADEVDIDEFYEHAREIARTGKNAKIRKQARQAIEGKRPHGKFRLKK